MTTTELSHALSTHEGFAQRVKIDRRATNTAGLLIVLSILAIIYNAVSTFRTMGEYPGANFFAVFFSVSGETPVDTVWFVILVFAPIILLPLALGFFIYSKMTASKVAEATFEAYRARGYIARQGALDLAVQLNNDRNTTNITLVSHPSIGEEEFGSTVNAINQHLGTLDKKQRKQFAKDTVKAGVAKTIPATALFPSAPAAALLATMRPSEYVAVIPAGEGPGGSALRLLQLK